MNGTNKKLTLSRRQFCLRDAILICGDGGDVVYWRFA